MRRAWEQLKYVFVAVLFVFGILVLYSAFIAMGVDLFT